MNTCLEKGLAGSQNGCHFLRMPWRLLRDLGTNFMSSIIDKMCKILSMKKLWTMPYHLQTNGLVERSCQIIMRMVGKLGEDKKANLSGHLAEIGNTYNGTQSAMTRYSQHYLMFGWRPRLPVDFYFPTFRSTEVPMRGASAKCVDEYVATVYDQLRATLWEDQAQSMTELVLWLKDRHCGFEAWWSCLSEGWCLSGKEEDKRQVGG